MKDYRTWWRRGVDVEAMFNDCNRWISLNPYLANDDEIDCVHEQLWAVKQGLADEPGSGRE